MRNLKNFVLVGGACVVLALTGCQTSRDTSDRTAGRALDDKNITERVEEKLAAETVYKFNDVDVKTFDGVVQLSGFVSTNEQKSRAEELARNVDGVRQVINALALKSGTGLTPTGRSDQDAAPVRDGTRSTDNDNR